MKQFFIGVLLSFLVIGIVRWIGIPFTPGDLLRIVIGEPTPIKSAVVIVLGILIIYLIFRSVRHKTRENTS